MAENNNPLHDGVIIVVIFILISSAIGKCTKNVPDAPPPTVVQEQLPIERLWTGIKTYFAPFVAATLIAFGFLSLLCRYGVMGNVHSVDYRQIAVVISILSAIALFWPGIPDPYNKWRYGIWAGILFGAPLAFWLFAKTNTQDEDERLVENTKEPFNIAIENLQMELDNAEIKSSNLSYELEEANDPGPSTGEIETPGFGLS